MLEPVSLPLFDATPASVIAATPSIASDAPDLDEQGATDAINVLLSCIGGESQAIRYAVFTDSYLAHLFIGESPADQPAFERMIAVGGVPEAETPVLTGVLDLETLEDGRVVVTMDIQTDEGTLQDRVILAWDAGQQHWLIDEIVSLDPPPATPPGATQERDLIDVILSVDPSLATPES